MIGAVGRPAKSPWKITSTALIRRPRLPGGQSQLHLKAADLCGERLERSDARRIRFGDGGQVDGSARRTALQNVGDLFADVHRDFGLSLLGRSSQMRRQNIVRRQIEQGIGRIGRLLGKHIEGDSAYFAALDRLRERRFVHDTAARAVDDPHAVFHQGELRGGDQAARLIAERGVNGDEVAAAEQVVQGDRLHAHAARHLFRHEGVVGDQFDAEAFQPFRDRAADPAQAQHADRLAEDLRPDELLAIPSAVFHTRVGLWDLTGQRQQHADGEFGSGECVAVGRVDDQHPLLCGRFNIDVIDTDARASDDLETIGGGENRGGDFRLAAHGQRVVLSDNRQQLFRFQPMFHVHFDARRCP